MTASAEHTLELIRQLLASGISIAGSSSGGTSGGPLRVTDSPGTSITGTIANGASLSGAMGRLPLGTGSLEGMIIIVDGWTSASMTFQVSPDGITFSDLYDSNGNEVTVPAFSGARAIAVVLEGAAAFKVRSGTTANPVAQGAARAIAISA